MEVEATEHRSVFKGPQKMLHSEHAKLSKSDAVAHRKLIFIQFHCGIKYEKYTRCTNKYLFA